jgi:hypothetical protein
MQLPGGGPATGLRSAAWIFLDRGGFALKTPIEGVGFVRISLDSLVRIETFQWVKRKNSERFFFTVFPSAFAARVWEQTILAYESAELSMEPA